MSSLLPVTVLAFSALVQGPVLLEVVAEDEVRPAATLNGRGEERLLLPYLTRSPYLPRAGRTARGLGLRLTRAGAELSSVRAFSIRHAVGEQVLLVEDELWVLGGIELPEDARSASGRSILPELARYDGACAPRDAEEGWARVGSPPAGAWLFEVLPPGSSPEQEALSDGALRVRAPFVGRAFPVEPGTSEHALRGTKVDQLFLAPIVRRAPEADRELELRSPRNEGISSEGALGLWFASPPEAPEGETWTIVLDIAWAAAPTRTGAPVEASVEDEPRGMFLAHDLMTHMEGPDEQLDIRPTMGPGAAWGDVNGDGHVDLYLVQGAGREGSVAPENRLLLNRDGTFVDATDVSGAGDTGAGMGAQFFDADGDGDLDLYVANYGADVFYENDGSGKLTDRSEAAGVGGNLWSAGVAAADADRDGDLDLYVASYLEYDEALVPPDDELARFRREDPVLMLPFAFPGQRNTFLRNDTVAQRGGIRFTDASDELGVLDAEGRGMQPVFWDFDRDGDTDLYVANDVSYNKLWSNRGDGSFEDVSFSSGMDDPRGGMGVAVGDVDEDGDEDLFLTNWQLEANALYRNNLLSHASQRHLVASFRDVIVQSGLGPYGIGVTSWGAELFDADNDGDLDLYIANGYTSPDYESTGICVGQPDHFFLNEGNGRFREASELAGPALADPYASRCAVSCDYDQDGDLDLIVTANNGPVRLLENRGSASGAHWMIVRLRGRGANPTAIGAEVTLESGGRKLRRSLRAGTSYLAGNAPELYFGLGPSTSVEALVVRWPSGRETTHAVAGVDRIVTLDEESN